MQLFPVMYLWLIAGVLLVLFDTLHLGGIGIFFAGLGALVAGAAVWIGIIGQDAYIAQWLVFLIAAALWAAVLWKPILTFRRRRHGKYNNIVGETAYVGSQGISPKKGGEATWSGTIMKARLADDILQALEAGTPVVITGIEGATLVVKPKE